ncbi:TPA: hypothetical protein ACXJLS_001627 [Stenotrophomonas maltophilia]
MKFKFRFFMVIVFIFYGAGCRYQEGGGAPSGKTCGVEGRSACRVSFRALASTPRLFDGKSIRVEGYLGVSRGLFVLNSSKELFEAGVTEETQVRIKGPIDLQRDVFNRYAYSWVSVTGEFRLRKTDGSTDDLLLGEMHAPLDVQSLRVPGPIPRATFGDVSVDLEDLK